MRAWDYPYDPVIIACKKCGRSGCYSKARFLELVGENTPLPNARHKIAKDCKYKPDFAGNIASQCEVIFPELAKKASP